MRGYRFALDPTPAQEQRLRSHCGGARFAFNHMFAVVKKNLDQRAAERSYGMADDQLTPAVNWSAYGLRKTWNHLKGDAAPWWPENSKEAYASGLANLAAALRNWVESRSGQPNGPRTGFPRFKTKKSHLSCRFSTGAFGLLETDRRHVRLPRVGVVRTHESTRKLARRITAGTVRLRSATISYGRGRWWVSFSVEVEHTKREPLQPDMVVGVDLGVRHLAVLSTPVVGVSDDVGMVANTDHLERALKELRRLQREAARRCGPDKRANTPPSRRWQRTQVKVARLHARVANRRTDGLHQLTAALATRFALIVIEDLNVAGLLRNRRLSRRIASASWGELRRQLVYKTAWRGGELIVAGRFFASSKTCSNCGVVKGKLRLSERIYHCDACGMGMDRDLNAARNLAALVDEATVGASSSSCGATINGPTGNSRKTSHAGRGYSHGKPHEGNAA